MPRVLTLYNTLTKRAEPFRPADPSCVTFYTCGPTVYDFAHIGNFRSFLVADTLRRFLQSSLCLLEGCDGVELGGPRRVVHIMNITDVGHMTDDQAADGSGEDKMQTASKRLAEAKKAGKLPPDAPEGFDPANPADIARFYTIAFLSDARTLGLRVAKEQQQDARVMPRATEHIAEMLHLVVRLMETGHAYAADSAVYFDTQSFPEYGALSGNTLDRLRVGAGGRVDEANQSHKKHPADFLLWKSDESHIMRWDPAKFLGAECAASLNLRPGYPGWHIECSAMADEAIRAVSGHDSHQVDLHSGGEDNIFPHHECEIAQSRCAFTDSNGQPLHTWARHWVHVRHLMVEGEKMSKSRGNFFTIRDLLSRGFEPAAIRLELIKTHYRSNANFTEQGLLDSARIVERWRRFLAQAEASSEEGERNERAAAEFMGAMHDDLNTAGAIGAINAWINRTGAPTKADARLMRAFDSTLGLLELETPAGAAQGPDESAIDALVEARNLARRSKDFAESDRIRDQLAAMGVEIKDTPQGTTWTRRASL